jgi:hypothetical protein
VTKEHLWSDWLRKAILESRAAGGQKHFRAEIERDGRTAQYSNPSLEQTVGMPCRQCNNGWMHALENEVKDFMTPMAFRGDKVLLNPERRLVLSRWAVKTAMVYEFTSGDKDTTYFTAAERLAFKQTFDFPENLWIWTGRYDGVRPMHAVLRRATNQPAAPIIYSFTFSANFLVLQVFAFRLSAGNLSSVATATKTERLLDLWPTSGWQSWPPNTTIDDDTLAVLDDRFVNVLKRPRKNF